MTQMLKSATMKKNDLKITGRHSGNDEFQGKEIKSFRGYSKT